MKTVVITGGSEGLGKAIAEYLVDSYSVYILARTEANLRGVAEEIGCKYKVCDVSDYSQIEQSVNEIIAESGCIDVFINNAGVWVQGGIEDTSATDIKKTIEINTIGVINGTKAVVSHMKKRKGGIIIQINSQAGLYGKAERSVYNASKWAITGFTKSIQEELEPHGVRVTGLYPAMLHTELFSKQGIEKDMNRALKTNEVARTIKFVIESEDTTHFPEIGIKKFG